MQLKLCKKESFHRTTYGPVKIFFFKVHPVIQQILESPFGGMSGSSNFRGILAHFSIQQCFSLIQKALLRSWHSFSAGRGLDFGPLHHLNSFISQPFRDIWPYVLLQNALVWLIIDSVTARCCPVVLWLQNKLKSIPSLSYIYVDILCQVFSKNGTLHFGLRSPLWSYMSKGQEFQNSCVLFICKFANPTDVALFWKPVQTSCIIRIKLYHVPQACKV